MRTPDDLPHLAPEVQLFYKAQEPRPKDQEDFEAVYPMLGDAQRQWLADATAEAYGEHPWSEHLR